jgi:hypothetical protein
MSCASYCFVVIVWTNCVVSIEYVLELEQKYFGDLHSHWPLACDFHLVLVTEMQNQLKCVEYTSLCQMNELLEMM